MSRYLIAATHTPAECVAVLEEVLTRGPDALASYEWGCLAGDHTGYAIVEAATKGEIETSVPARLRGKTRIVELATFTPAQVAGFRQSL